MSLNNSFIYLPKLWPTDFNHEDSKECVFQWIINFSLIFSSLSLFSLMISYPLLVINVQSYNKNIHENMAECAESLIELENYVAQFSTNYYLQKLNRSVRSKNENQTYLNQMNPKKCCIKGIPGNPGKNGKNGIPGSNGVNGLPGKAASMKSLWDQCVNCNQRFKLHAVLRDSKRNTRQHITNQGTARKLPIKIRKQRLPKTYQNNQQLIRQ